MKSIKKLEQVVIDRIAAGEILHRPCNAVKELMENSLDAKATNIHMNVISGGFDLIKVIDNGHGIKLEDMPLVCERHATSKIEQYQDLNKLNSFGFRGEALASISHVAHVTITSKHINSEYGYQGVYQDGKLVSEPKLCAAKQGTIIIIQHLFSNVPLRKKTLKNPHEEFNAILDCVQKYALHNTHVSFSLYNKDTLSIKTHGSSLSIQNRGTLLHRIQHLYGHEASMNLKHINHQQDKWSISLYFTDITKKGRYPMKSTIFVLFVNNRLVENAKLKRVMNQLYTEMNKGTPTTTFTYISLTVYPRHIDVNIHPTKNEVYLLDQDMIIEVMKRIVHDSFIDIAQVLPSMEKMKQTKPLPPKA
ncbi:histidine kinase-like ATPase, partial [Gilbertella persicaria]|uniref:histidine kinase-like ATPase n=1 Tax=Gilbertella persicaria TaxID=101096 RepID=UPI00221F7153